MRLLRRDMLLEMMMQYILQNTTSCPMIHTNLLQNIILLLMSHTHLFFRTYYIYQWTTIYKSFYKKRRKRNNCSKKYSRVYHLDTSSRRKKVCKESFLATFATSNGRLDRLLKTSVQVAVSQVLTSAEEKKAVIINFLVNRYSRLKNT